MAVTEEEYRSAIEASNRFKIPLFGISYNRHTDVIFFKTAWGERFAKHGDVPFLKDVPSDLLDKAYVSATGIHIDEIDFDVNAAGLLALVFPDLQPQLVNSY
jgi:hypothetical protein